MHSRCNGVRVQGFAFRATLPKRGTHSYSKLGPIIVIAPCALNCQLTLWGDFKDALSPDIQVVGSFPKFLFPKWEKFI